MRFHIKGVASRRGDKVTGALLGKANTFTKAFTIVGRALDRGKGERFVCIVVYDNEKGDRWTVFPNL